MVDLFSRQKRSEIMSKVRGKNTVPEIMVRSALHKMGYRFRLHGSKLPGKPDIVLPKYKTVVFVHGCFWHRHKGCKRTSTPSTNTKFWESKFEKNVRRDQEVKHQLEALGWKTITVWECAISEPEKLASKLARQLKCL